MKDKKRAVRVSRPHTAEERADKSSVISLRTKRHIVNVDMEQFGYIIGGLLLGMGLLAMFIIIPISFGGCV